MILFLFTNLIIRDESFMYNNFIILYDSLRHNKVNVL